MSFSKCLKNTFKNHTNKIPGSTLQDNGYFRSNRENLIDPSIETDIEKMYSQGDGNELNSKFQAAYSSAALVANHFGPFISKSNLKNLFIQISE